MYKYDIENDELQEYIRAYPKSYKLYMSIIDPNQFAVSKVYMLRVLHKELLNKFSQTVKDFLPVNDIKLCHARTYLGICKRNINETSCDISISEHLFKIGFIPIVNVMAHEMIHSIKGFPRGHKDAFIKMMNKLNCIYGLHIQTKGAYQCTGHLKIHIEEKKPKYCLVCTSCGNKYYYYRKTKYVKNYIKCHCGKCKGQLKLEILKY